MNKLWLCDTNKVVVRCVADLKSHVTQFLASDFPFVNKGNVEYILVNGWPTVIQQSFDRTGLTTGQALDMGTHLKRFVQIVQ